MLCGEYLVDGTTVTDHEVFILREIPRVDEQVCEELLIGTARDTVDVVVGAHHARHASLYDGMERGLVHRDPVTLRDVHLETHPVRLYQVSIDVHAGRLGPTMHIKMLSSRNHLQIFVVVKSTVLKRLDENDAELRGQKRVLPQRFLAAAAQDGKTAISKSQHELGGISSAQTGECERPTPSADRGTSSPLVSISRSKRSRFGF